MKNFALLLVAAAMLGASAPAVSAVQDAAGGAATAQADPKEAVDAWNAWSAEKDQARKVQLGRDIITKYPGSKVADNVMGTAFQGVQNKSYTNEQVTELARAYYDAYTAAGKSGQYSEYTFGWVANAETDNRKFLQISDAYIQKYPQGSFVEFLRKRQPGARYALFTEALKAKNFDEAARYASQAGPEYEFAYSYGLSDAAWRDVVASGVKSPVLSRANEWASKSIAFVESGKVPTGADQAKWAAEKPKTLNMLYRLRGYVAFLNASQRGAAATPEDFAAAVQPLETAIRNDQKDILSYYFLGQAYNAQYAAHASKFGQVPADQQETPEAKALLDRVNAAADKVIENWVRVIALAGTDPNWAKVKETVQPVVVDLYKYRHEDNPNGWQQLINSAGSPTAAAPGGAAK